MALGREMANWFEIMIVAGAVGAASWYMGRLGWRAVMSLFGRVSAGCSSCGAADGCLAKPSEEASKAAGSSRGCESFKVDGAA